MDSKINLPADILWVNSTTHKDTYWVDNHSHDTYCHLVYIRSGTCSTTVNGETYEMRPSTISIVTPKDTHSMHSIPSGGEIIFWEVKFIVHSNSLRRAIEQLPKVFLADEMQHGLLELIVQNSHGTREKTNINATRFHLASLLYYTCRDTLNSHQQNCPSIYLKGIDISRFSQATVGTVLYLEKNYMYDISLEAIGAEIGYHPNYISAMVKRDLSIHTNELLAFIRIQKAAEFLYYSDFSIKEIYQQTGFINSSHFSRTFKKMVGISPSQYRRSYPTGIFAPNEETLHDEATPVWINGLLRDYIESKAE